MNCVFVRQFSVLQLIFESSMSLNSVHVDLDVRCDSGVVEGCKTVILVTHYRDTINVNQRTCHIGACTERADFETVNIFIVLESLL